MCGQAPPVLFWFLLSLVYPLLVNRSGCILQGISRRGKSTLGVATMHLPFVDGVVFIFIYYVSFRKVHVER